MKSRIIIVDDEKDFLTLLKDNARFSGQDEFFDLKTFSDPLQALNYFRFYGADVVVTDVRMQGMDGMSLFRSLRSMDSQLPVIIMSAYASVGKAVEAVRMGAYYYFEKPVLDHKAFWVRIREAALKRKSLSDSAEMRMKLDLEESIVGYSEWKKETIEHIRKIAHTNTPILLSGETGTGKAFLARLIHHIGLSSKGLFVSVDCKAYSSGSLERALFGFTENGSANEAPMPGLFDSAEGGTLFVRAIEDMPMEVQGKLYSALQHRTFRRADDTTQVPLNARIMASTTEDPVRLRDEGRLLVDLFYQLSAVSFSIPPLRERPDDILPLAFFFLAQSQKQLGKRIDGISFDAMSALYMHSWNGNLKELEKAIESAVIRCNGIDIMPHDLNFLSVGESKKGVSVTTMKDAARMVILAAMQKTGGRKRQAAQLLGIHRNTLNNKMKELGIDEDAWSLERPVDGKNGD